MYKDRNNNIDKYWDLEILDSRTKLYTLVKSENRHFVCASP